MSTFAEYIRAIAEKGVSCSTGRALYDDTYDLLLNSCANMRSKVFSHPKVDLSEENRILALGLCVWNTGRSRFDAAAHILNKKPEDWQKLLSDIDENKSTPSECFVHAKKFIGGGAASKAMPTKLLHWFYPEYFPILDSKVDVRLRKHVSETRKNGRSIECVYGTYTSLIHDEKSASAMKLYSK